MFRVLRQIWGCFIRIEIGSLSSHTARLSCITILLQKGVPVTTIMKLTGHTDVKTLMKYENTGDDALEDALETFT